MKEKILATLVAFGLVGSASAIEINENLSINGFIDTSYTHVETQAGGLNDSQGLGLDEIELNFLFNVGGASGAIHIDDYDARDRDNTADGGDYAHDSEIDVEQAFLTYSLESGVSFTIGKYGSGLGFEREDPGGLYTYSRAYGGTSGSAFNLGNVDANVYEGLKIGYDADAFSIDISLQNGGDADIETDELDLEFAIAYTGIENLNIGGGYRFDNRANDQEEIDVLNVHISTVMGKFLIGAEYTELENGGSINGAAGRDQDLDGWMVLADYDVSDKLGVALRISSNELDANNDWEQVTIAPNYSLTESLGVILEYSDIDTGAGGDANALALEVTFTF
jgi:hypothetical protein